MTGSPAAAPSEAHRLDTLPRLGVGVMVGPVLRGFVQQHVEALDYVAIIPDRFWADDGPGTSPRYHEGERLIELLDQVAERRPIVGHSVGLSIGSAELFDTEHVAQIARWHERYRFPWHSDHMSFNRVPGHDAHTEPAGIALPVPYDTEVLDLIAGRVAAVQAAIPAPFLLENNVYYVDLPDQEMTEPEFLNRLTARTGCGLLLDVHNVYVNATNHGFDPRAFIGALDLTRVVEVHVAGGTEANGIYTDSHSSTVPDPVWELLDEVLAAAPNLCGITLEFEDSFLPELGAEGLLAQVELARAAWARRPA
jgi:uncharacterized protein